MDIYLLMSFCLKLDLICNAVLSEAGFNLKRSACISLPSSLGIWLLWCPWEEVLTWRGFPWQLQHETSLGVNSHPLLISRAKLGKAMCFLRSLYKRCSFKRKGRLFCYLSPPPQRDSSLSWAEFKKHLGNFHGSFIKGRTPKHSNKRDGIF